MRPSNVNVHLGAHLAMTADLPATCQIALKEWASVLQACARGEQLVLIRKGGLIEPGSGFELVSRQFLFYPTFEHQTVGFLRPTHQRDFEDAIAKQPSDGRLCLELCGSVVSSIQSRDPTLIKRLEPVHIYNDAFLEQRLRWQPEQPLVVVVVRVFRLPSPQRLPLRSHYAGCKSWVELEQPVSLEGATPVLDDQVFDERLTAIRATLSEAS